jgi:hypothetical protein
MQNKLSPGNSIAAVRINLLIPCRAAGMIGPQAAAQELETMQ